MRTLCSVSATTCRVSVKHYNKSPWSVFISTSRCVVYSTPWGYRVHISLRSPPFPLLMFHRLFGWRKFFSRFIFLSGLLSFTLCINNTLALYSYQYNKKKESVWVGLGELNLIRHYVFFIWQAIVEAPCFYRGPIFLWPPLMAQRDLSKVWYRTMTIFAVNGSM